MANSSQTRLEARHIRALAWAVEQANDWRGSLIGADYDDQESVDAQTERLAGFDAQVKLARDALRIVKQQRRKT